MPIVNDVSTEIRPRSDGCAISDEYTAVGELDKPMHSPMRTRATSNWMNINSLSVLLASAIIPHDTIDRIFIVINVFFRPYLSST